MQANPSLSAEVYSPSAAGGWRKYVSVNHPTIGGFSLAASQAGWNDTLGVNRTVYALNPAYGVKRPTVHSRGTKEISWSISGDLTAESSLLMNLLEPASRGVSFTSIQISQAFEGGRFTNSTGWGLPWSDFSVEGSSGGLVTFTLSGRSCQEPSTVSVVPFQANPVHPIPAWASGNNLVKSWKLSHSISLSPVWGNSIDEMPRYYRPGVSSIKIAVMTVRQITPHYQIRFVNYAGAVFSSAVINNRSFMSGDRMSGFTYSAECEDIGATALSGYLPGVTVSVPLAWPAILWPSGL